MSRGFLPRLDLCLDFHLYCEPRGHFELLTAPEHTRFEETMK
jgi:hypothetical protein